MDDRAIGGDERYHQQRRRVVLACVIGGIAGIALIVVGIVVVAAVGLYAFTRPANDGSRPCRRRGTKSSAKSKLTRPRRATTRRPSRRLRLCRRRTISTCGSTIGSGTPTDLSSLCCSRITGG